VEGYVAQSRGPHLLIRIVWYFLVGWWLTGFALAAGYLAALTIVGLPLAFWIFNRTGTLLTLRPRSQQLELGPDGTVAVRRRDQRPLLLRALWFVLVGWWAAGFWMTAAYLLCLTIVLLPVGVMMLNRLPEVFTLQRN
jgi:uncharacterized membrane protein YccF (DUF307 family)